MGGCRCSYKNCPNTTKTTENIHFFHYPVKHKERCKMWIVNAGKPQFCDLEEEQLRNKVICEMHFEDQYFPNMQKKRLLQSAVPTLDAGCEPEMSMLMPMHINSELLQDVNVLPANEDGTIFVLDTDCMFNRVLPSSQKVESYIYKNGIILPSSTKSSPEPICNVDSYKTTPQKDSFYTRRESNYLFHEPQPRPDPPIRRMQIIKTDLAENRNNPHKIHHINFDESHDVHIESPRPVKPRIIQHKTTILRPASPQKIEQKQIIAPQQEAEPVKPQPKTTIERTYLKKIKQHSREIATIKRMLKHKRISGKPDNQSVLAALKNRLPPSLYTLVNLSLNSNCELSDSDVAFFASIKSTSSQVYDLLLNKYRWNVPSCELIDSLNVKQEINHS